MIKFENRIAIYLISAYQRWISPFLGDNCRFYPSCSHYSKSCLEKYSLARGGWLAFRRIVRCQPYCDGGFDPVPVGKANNPALPVVSAGVWGPSEGLPNFYDASSILQARTGPPL